MLSYLRRNRTLQIDVLLKIVDGPALHIEQRPRIHIAGNQVFAHEDGPQAPRGRFVIDGNHPRIGNVYFYVFLLEPIDDFIAHRLIGNRHAE